MTAIVTLIGHIGNPGELKSVGDNDRLGFTLATSRRVKVGDTWENRTTWWKCDAWGADARFLWHRIAKGSGVTVIGEAYLDEWTTQEGDKRQTLKCRATKVALHDRKTTPTPADGTATTDAAPAPAAPAAQGTHDEPPF